MLCLPVMCDVWLCGMFLLVVFLCLCLCVVCCCSVFVSFVCELWRDVVWFVFCACSWVCVF